MFSALLDCSCLHPWLETAGYHGGFFMSVPFGISVLRASLAPSLGYMRLKKMKTDKGTHHHVFAQTPKPLASLSSLHLSESFYVCFVYNVPGYCG